MIKLATAFSGIGAIEHALQRMDLEHKLIFACDNGDVDILTKDIKVDISEIDKEFILLEQLINKVKNISNDKTTDELYEDLNKNRLEYEEQLKELSNLNFEEIEYHTLKILKNIVGQDDLKTVRKKEYCGFINNISREQSINSKIIEVLKSTLEILNDFKKDNDLSLLDITGTSLYKSSDKINWEIVIDNLKKAKEIFEGYESKKVLKGVRDISERLGMLHEKINSFYIHKELEQLPTYAEKKKYIDKLYEGKESQNKVRTSYLANYDLDPRDFHWNVSFLDGKQYQNQVDLFVGGSPCQSFSLVGKQRGLEDTRGTLFYEYARLVSEIRPKVFIYENVKAILSNDNGKTWETIKQVFTDLNYTWSYQVLNAKDYGVPQNRERVFVVGFRNDLFLQRPFEFPVPIPLEKKMQDFLLDNVSGKYYLNKKGVDFVTSEKNLTKKYTQIDGEIQLCQKKNQQFNWHGDFVFEEENKDKEKTMKDLEKYFLSEKVKKYVLASGTKGFYSKPETDLEIARPLLTTMHKMHRAGVDNYVTTDGRLRKLAPRECLRLMGFCDSFKIAVSDTSIYQQAGNSIVVDVLINIMKQIILSYPNILDNN
ncbi:DNA (cytosine-5-)-methyltransferase [Sporanaerobium hydrogeniformans]|uniref:DNA (Cytosine-5-)-methyltransferase n=1 Tax=Sporanaerobium hydrogeniformans TaxID=3072179 RepID=A0AC61DD89_9FIRM|nr:DNA (cytosine-5-)-methyltransferase [Sporanaerobium hydrogeniformans]PHV70688.1 DNA (cytosine-5-)-methyltransferase [Sporanaerobium hydrogeniformans]